MAAQFRAAPLPAPLRCCTLSAHRVATRAKQNGLDDGVARTPQHALDTPTTFRQWCEDTLKPALHTV